MSTEVPGLSVASVMAAAGLAVTVLAGSLLTAQEVVVGNPSGTFVRFVLSVAVGGYYLYLFHLSRGRRFFSGPGPGQRLL
jgi:hypothetical protein